MIAGEPEPQRIAAALGALLGVPPEAVDVAPEGAAERDWDAAVLATHASLAGDVSWSLEIDFGLSVSPEPTEPETAVFLARHLREVVVHPWREVLPGAYWLAGPDGEHTRAMIDEVEDFTDPPVYRIEAVEQPVRALPGVPVRTMTGR